MTCLLETGLQQKSIGYLWGLNLAPEAEHQVAALLISLQLIVIITKYLLGICNYV